MTESILQEAERISSTATGLNSTAMPLSRSRTSQSDGRSSWTTVCRHR